MIGKIVNLLILVTLLFSCSENFSMMNGRNPSKESFKYYNPNFEFDELSNLKLNKKYFVQDSIAIAILVFFKDGFVNKYPTTTINGVSRDRNESGVIMGYYKLVKDSIFFSTRSYYQHKQTFYKGNINKDTLNLEIKYPSKKIIMQKFILFL